MAIERERKFILERPPPADLLVGGVQIRQGYLAEEGDVEVRVRITADRASLTVKAGRGLSRTEVEATIPITDAEALWPHTSGRRIDKIRYRIPVGSETAELDVYDGTLRGLLVVEVEFDSDAAAAEFTAPPWFGREVTGQSEWSNAALARRGLPHG